MMLGMKVDSIINFLSALQSCFFPVSNNPTASMVSCTKIGGLAKALISSRCCFLTLPTACLASSTAGSTYSTILEKTVRLSYCVTMKIPLKDLP